METLTTNHLDSRLASEEIEYQNIEYERPFLYKKQLDAIFNDKRYALIEASTKTGKTHGCIIWLAELALLEGRPGRNYWWIAPISQQADIAFRRLKRGLPNAYFKANDTLKTITLGNGAVIWFKSADNPDSLYGEDVWGAVFDEASRAKDEAWHAARSTLTATNGPIRMIGNVKGRKNWFFMLCRKAEAGEPNMHYSRLIAYDAVEAGVLSAEEVEDAKRQLPEAVFRELYLAEPSDDGGNPFGLGAIERCVGPMSGKLPVAWGWDVAKSVDWTVGIGFDEDGACCRFERFQKPWPETIDYIKAVTGNVPAFIDSTGVGDPVLDILQKTNNNFEGFKFSSSSKQQLMEGLAVAIQQTQISYPLGVIKNELDNFEYQYTRTGVTYSAPEGLHDDCVCALALAVRRKNFQIPGMGIMLYYRQEYEKKKAKELNDKTNKNTDQ